MVQLIKQLLTDWNSEKDQRLKMQRAYFVLAVLIAVVAGLITLVNFEMGRILTMIAGFLAVIFITNSIVWALLDAFVIQKINKLSKASKKR